MEYGDAPTPPKNLSFGDLRKAMRPLLEAVKSEIIANLPEPDKLDVDSLVDKVVDKVRKNITIEQKTITNEVEKSVQMPGELVELLTILSKKSLQKTEVVVKDSIRMTDFRPHDQAVLSNNLGYYGFVHPTGAWYIVENNGEKKQQRYAAGSSDYSSAWKKYTRQDYKPLNEAMKYAI